MSNSAQSKNDPAATSTVDVSLGDRSYRIYVGEGLLAGAGELIAQMINRPRTVIVTDENVARFHLPALTQSLEDNNVSCPAIVLPPGEKTKSPEHLFSLLDRLLEMEVERNDTIIALGGGVIGDLTGFAASILRRGIHFIQIPTTLLAQVDSSVGGKTGINSRFGKNLIGSFYQPRMVMCDVGVLKTLPDREFKAGYAEVLKYGVICDEDFFDWLDDPANSVDCENPQNMIFAVRRSCEIKADVVARDEREEGIRAILNFGHTFGHALEAITGYGPELIHGEAVSIGMALATNFSEELKLCSGSDRSRLEKHLRSLGMKNSLADIRHPLSTDELIRHMYQDKKVEAGQLTFILMKRIGETFVDKSIAEDKVRRFLEKQINHSASKHP